MYDVSLIEMYANLILDDINTARKNRKKINMKRLKAFGENIADWAKQEMNLKDKKIPICGVSQF